MNRKIYYVNEADCRPPHAAEQMLGECLMRGWTVVNAPRPLGGEVQWQGPYRVGIFYAAGPEEFHGLFGDWNGAEAEIRLITDAEIRRRVDARLIEDGYSLAYYLSERLFETETEAIRYFAEDVLRLPWHGAGSRMVLK